MYTEITHCRMCGNPNLVSILHLVDRFLTGVFPRNKEETLISGSL